jgi:competence protein ComFC
MLAKELARLSNKPCLVDCLHKIKDTGRQHSLAKQDRFSQIQGSIELNTKHLKKIEGKRILLIDDVHTTGATASECAKVLNKGASCVTNVLTIAKTCLD